MAGARTSRFTDGTPETEGWEVAWLHCPGLVVLGLFDHVLGPGEPSVSPVSFEEMNHPVRWPQDILNAFLPAERDWIIELPKVFFRPLAGSWPWSRKRRGLHEAGAQWRGSVGGRIIACLPPSLGTRRTEPFACAVTGPEQVVSWVFVPSAPVRLNAVTTWRRLASSDAASLVADSCDRILAQQGEHVFVAAAADRKQELEACLAKAAQKLGVPIAENLTLRTSPVR